MMVENGMYWVPIRSLNFPTKVTLSFETNYVSTHGSIEWIVFPIQEVAFVCLRFISIGHHSRP